MGGIKHKVVLLFMGLILCFLQSCSTEEVLLEREANIKTVTKEEAIQYLKQNLLKTNGTKAEKTTAYFNYGAITQEKITNSNKFLTVIPLLNSNKTQSSRVLLLRVNDTLKSAVFTMSPEGEVKTKEFSGRIMIIGIDGEFINGFRVKDGFLISQFIQKNPSKQSIRIANKATVDNTTESIQLDEVIIPPRKKAAIEINYIFDWYSAYDNSNSDSYLWGFVENSGSGGGSTEPVVEEEIINELTGEAKCLNDLLDKNGDSFVQNLLANFEGESEFDIKIVSKDNVFSTETGLEVNGKTLSPNNNVIVIEISASRTNDNAALEGARVILHEYIHADIFRKLNTLYNASGILDFKKTYEAYGNQHATIAGLYLNSMQEALKGFHKNVLTDDYNKYTNYFGEAPSDAFYEALAWGGLRDNDVEAWVNLPAEKKTAIAALANRAILLSKTVPCPN